MLPLEKQDKEKIHCVVENFYHKALGDDLIGHHFSSLKNLSSHINHITDIWCHIFVTTPNH